MRYFGYAFALGCLVTWAAQTEYEARHERARMLHVAQERLSSLLVMQYPVRIDGKKTVTVGVGSNGQFYVEGDILGRRRSFLVDTGAADVGLRYDVAASAGLRWNDGREKCYSSANGKVCARTFLAPQLTIAGITKKDVLVAMFPEGALQGNILGMSFLGKLSRYEIESGTLRLEE